MCRGSYRAAGRGGDVERRAPGTHCAATKAAPDASIIAATAPRMHHHRRHRAFQSDGAPNGTAIAEVARHARSYYTMAHSTWTYFNTSTILHDNVPIATSRHIGSVPRNSQHIAMAYHRIVTRRILATQTEPEHCTATPAGGSSTVKESSRLSFIFFA